MYAKQTSTTLLQPDQQILYISQQVDQIRNILQESGSRLPPKALESLALLAGRLTRLSHQVAKQQEERQDLLALADIGRVVNSSLELNDVLRIVMDTIIRLTGAERGFLMLKDENDELSIHVARNMEQESIASSEFAISRTVINRVSNEGKPVLTTNAQEDPRFGGQESIIAYNLRSILCVPLKVKGELTGVIYADNRIRAGLFTDTERDLLSAFSNQAAVAIENARLFESVRQTLAEVTELKNLMANVFASIASGVITADIDDRITLSNRAAETILGKTESELVGHQIDECLAPIAQLISDPISTVLNTDKAILGLEVQPTLPHRGPIDLLFNLSPLKDATQTTQGVAIVLDDLTEKKRLEAQRRLFGRMISPAVIDQLDPNKIQLGGERTNITTLFADVRGFTSFSETLAPEQLVSILNRYLSAAAEAVLKEEGTIDKFMGDAVMAWFNAPIPQLDHTLRAVRAALGLRGAIQSLHTELPTEYHLSFGVGIHYGEAVLGLVGSEIQFDYTAIGDSVNTARRIQENAAPDQILISLDAYDQVADKIKVRDVAPFQAKGKREPVHVYEVVGLV